MTRTVVLLHALSMDSAMWCAQRVALRRLGYRVVAVDQRGYGTTPLGAAAPDLELVVDDLARTLDERGAGEVVLAGSSMGGYVAMAFLRRHAHRVAALALLSTHAGADDARHRTEREIFAKLVLDPRSRRGVLDAATAKLLGATTRARRSDVVARVQEHVATTAPEAIAWSQRAIATRPDSFDVLRATEVPSVVLTGEEDELVPVAEAARMADALPRGRLVTVPGAGHLAPMETPDVVTRTLVELVRGC